jgi:hypothetical protein
MPACADASAAARAAADMPAASAVGLDDPLSLTQKIKTAPYGKKVENRGLIKKKHDQKVVSQSFKHGFKNEKLSGTSVA